MNELLPKERVQRLLEATRIMLQHASETWLLQCAQEHGLSVEGARLALEVSLEHNAPEEEISELLRLATPASNVHVVLASNVLSAPLRALAWASAQASIVTIRPSFHTPTFTSTLVNVARQFGLMFSLTTPSVNAQSDLANRMNEPPKPTRIHLYGSGETCNKVLKAYENNTDFEFHQGGFSAILCDEIEALKHIHELTRDFVLFDQTGCLSPRILFCVAPSETLTESLSHQLHEWHHRVPKGNLDITAEHERRMFLDRARCITRVRDEKTHCIVGPYELPNALIAPGFRTVSICRVNQWNEAIQWLTEREHQLIGVASPLWMKESLKKKLPYIRWAPIGGLQTPKLDGPADYRILKRQSVSLI